VDDNDNDDDDVVVVVLVVLVVVVGVDSMDVGWPGSWKGECKSKVPDD